MKTGVKDKKLFYVCRVSGWVRPVVVELRRLGEFHDGRLVYWVPRGVPAFGYMAFGVVDRATNVLQARPTTICPQNCIFCSVDAGLAPIRRWAEYVVDPEVIVEGVKKAVEEKGCNVEVLLDTVGDVLTYPHLVNLVRELKKLSGVRSVALETHGLLLSRKLIDRLAEAGLDRINLSIDTLNPEKARYLYGTPVYDVKRVIEVIEYAVKETPIDLHVTPLWLPGINDDDIVDVVNWAVRIGAGKRWPPVTVQKFVKHKYGRGHELRSVPWSEFWKFLEKLEGELGFRLRWTMNEWKMHYAKSIGKVLKEGELVEVMVLSRGLFKGEFLGMYRGKVLVAITPTRGVKLSTGKYYLAEVVSSKYGLYIVKVLNAL
ncbi:MAG: radical SAM protein [Desulfurococcaceae archaeon]